MLGGIELELFLKQKDATLRRVGQCRERGGKMGLSSTMPLSGRVSKGCRLDSEHSGKPFQAFVQMQMLSIKRLFSLFKGGVQAQPGTPEERYNENDGRSL